MRRGTYLNITLVAVLALLLGVVLLTRTSGSTSASPPAASSPRSAAEAFALAYLRRLEAMIPVADRHGPLALIQLTVTAQRGARARAEFTARDERNSYPAVAGLADTRGGWVVEALVPPDVATIDRPRTAPQSIPASASRAANAFAAEYIDYREGAAKQAPAGLAPLRRQLQTSSDPLARITPSHLIAGRPNLSFGPLGDGTLDATATATDAGRTLSVTFILKKRAHPPGRWQPWFLAAGSQR